MIKKIILVCMVAVVAGWGCSRTGNTERPLTRVDDRLHLYVRIPDGWDSVKLNTLQLDPHSKSGMAYVEGGVHVGFGTHVKQGELRVLVHVLAIPKSRAEGYEKNRYPATATRRLETLDHFVYTAVPDEKVDGVSDVVASLVYKK